MNVRPVKLKYGVSEMFSPGGGVTGVKITNVSVKVNNLVPQKDVAIHYLDVDGAWAEKALTWESNFGNYDLFSRNDNTFATTRFVIRCTMAGTTFWENNEGQDYHSSAVHPNDVGGGVVLSSATARRGVEAGGGEVFTTSWTEGEILVRNLSFQKRVGIRLSADGGKNFRDTDATFNQPVPVASGLSMVESWKFRTPEFNLDETAPDFLFAVFYHDLDTGEWFWDNNFDQNYSLSKIDSATLR